MKYRPKPLGCYDHGARMPKATRLDLCDSKTFYYMQQYGMPVTGRSACRDPKTGAYPERTVYSTGDYLQQAARADRDIELRRNLDFIRKYGGRTSKLKDIYTEQVVPLPPPEDFRPMEMLLTDIHKRMEETMGIPERLMQSEIKVTREQMAYIRANIPVIEHGPMALDAVRILKE
jgi:hypothetical protein